MKLNDIKKALYKEKPVAIKIHEDALSKSYETSLGDGTVVYFNVPFSDMGDGKFLDDMPAQELIRWLTDIPQVKEVIEKSIKELILSEYSKGNIVISTFDGIKGAPLNTFVTQPIEGILYDLNRSEEVVLTFIDDPKWVNDYAVCKTLRALKAEVDKLQAFKDYVHKRLDDMGIKKTFPKGKHSKEGCRIGDRLDILEKIMDDLWKENTELLGKMTG